MRNLSEISDPEHQKAKTSAHMRPARFPILGARLSVSWEKVEGLRVRAYENHRQSLEDLAKRGGLSPAEFWLCAKDIPLRGANWDEAQKAGMQLILEINKEEEKRPGDYTSDVFGCSRCGENHTDVLFRELKRCVYVFGKNSESDAVFTHWAPCPVNGEPILLLIRKVE